MKDFVMKKESAEIILRDNFRADYAKTARF